MGGDNKYIRLEQVSLRYISKENRRYSPITPFCDYLHCRSVFLESTTPVSPDPDKSDKYLSAKKTSSG